MCGRYRRRSDKQRIAEAFDAGMGLDDLYLEPNDDIAPGSIQPVVVSHAEAGRRIEPMRWGFKMPDRLLFNARSEGVATSKFWKESFTHRRCIVPADSFYEWAKVKSGKKPKYEITVPGREPFGMAGVWSLWKNPKTGAHEPAFAILTLEANSIMRPIHDRQPAILEPGGYREWLAEGARPPEHPMRLVPDEEMLAKPVEQATAGTLFGDARQ